MALYKLDNGKINGIDYRNNKPVLTVEGNKIRVRFIGDQIPFIECNLIEFIDGSSNSFTSVDAFVNLWNQYFGDRSSYGVPGGCIVAPAASDTVSLPNLSWVQNRGTAETRLYAIDEYGNLVDIMLQPAETTLFRVTMLKVNTIVTGLYLIYFK
jgi:hypothetical protein